MSTENLLLYIDPGTGSMLFAVLIGVFGAIGYIVRVAWVKIRFKLTRSLTLSFRMIKDTGTHSSQSAVNSTREV